MRSADMPLDQVAKALKVDIEKAREILRTNDRTTLQTVKRLAELFGMKVSAFIALGED